MMTFGQHIREEGNKTKEGNFWKNLEKRTHEIFVIMRQMKRRSSLKVQSFSTLGGLVLP
jgi:hypothetical protein